MEFYVTLPSGVAVNIVMNDLFILWAIIAVVLGGFIFSMRHGG